MKTFLLLFDSRTSSVEVRAIEDESSIVQQLRASEQRLATEPWLEIVLLTAADEDDLRKTHARFFESVDQLLEPA